MSWYVTQMRAQDVAPNSKICNWHHREEFFAVNRVVKLPVIYVGGKLPFKLPVTYWPLPARMGDRTLVLKGVRQSLGLMAVIITR